MPFHEIFGRGLRMGLSRSGIKARHDAKHIRTNLRPPPCKRESSARKKRAGSCTTVVSGEGPLVEGEWKNVRNWNLLSPFTP